LTRYAVACDERRGGTAIISHGAWARSDRSGRVRLFEAPCMTHRSLRQLDHVEDVPCSLQTSRVTAGAAAELFFCPAGS